MSASIRLSSPATREFWEIPVLYEDEHLLALNKPSCLPISPDRSDLQRANLMKLLHADIQRGARWVSERRIAYLAAAHRLDVETSGVILLAKDKAVLTALADLFGAERPIRTYVALVHGAPQDVSFEVDVKLAAHPSRIGLVRADPEHGKRARSRFEAIEYFRGYTLLRCQPLTGRTHQIRVHLQHHGLPIVGDEHYGGRQLMLSRLKANYRLKPNRKERPLIHRVALHAERLALVHPVKGIGITVSAPWPKDLTVAVKYLRLFASVSA